LWVVVPVNDGAEIGDSPVQVFSHVADDRVVAHTFKVSVRGDNRRQHFG